MVLERRKGQLRSVRSRSLTKWALLRSGVGSLRTAGILASRTPSEAL